MRKIIHLLLGIVCFLATSLHAQTPCVADVKFKDSTSGVYPLPYVATTRPTGGIDKTACIGKAYSFVWTIKVGDTITVPNPFGGGTIAVPIDSVKIGTTAAIEGLPTGITYACNPPNCTWKKQTGGCVALAGTPATSDSIQTYPLKINGKAYPGGIYATIYPTGYALTFPGAIAEGSYDLPVYAANDTRCKGTASDDLTEVSDMVVVPNPTSGKAVLRIESTLSDIYQFRLVDLLGRVIQSRPLSIQIGLNAYDLDVTNLPNGIYIFSLTKEGRVMSNKLIINN